MKRRATLCARAGAGGLELPAGVHPHAPPLYQTSGFEYGSHREAEAAANGEPYLYSRDANPTEDQLTRALAELEGAEAACLFASGMGAVTAALQAHLESGSHVVATEGLYGTTHAVLTDYLPRFGCSFTLASEGRPEEVAAALRPETRLVYLESISNPLLRVADVDGVAALCRARGVALVVDATFATPLLQRPIERGATLSVHSATKYIGGHGDLLLGVVAGSRESIAKVQRLRKQLGASADPFAAWLALRGLRTMALRLDHQVTSAYKIAQALEHIEHVERVHYPWLPSHPDHELAQLALDGGGAMVSFEVRGGLDGARRVYDRVRLVSRAASLGDVSSLLTHPATFSHHGLSDLERRRYGITDGLLRLSVGIEDARDLIDDLRQAMA